MRKPMERNVIDDAFATTTIMNASVPADCPGPGDPTRAMLPDACRALVDGRLVSAAAAEQHGTGV